MRIFPVVVSSILVSLPATTALYYPRGPGPIGDPNPDAPRAADWLQQRQLSDLLTQQSSTTEQSTTSEAATTTSTTTTSASSETANTSASNPTTNTTPTASTTPSTTRTQPTTAPPASTTAMSTNAAGSTVYVIVPVSQTASSTSASPSATSDQSDDSSGLGAKSIAGLVVVGVLLVLGIIGFVWWKMSKKRFSGFGDDDDAIKWPDLNDTTAMQPLPSRTDNEFSSSQSELTHVAVAPYYDHSASASVVDLSKGPVQHAPDSAYYDHAPAQPHEGGEGNRNSGYYDPYSGPVPQAFTPQSAAYGAQQMGDSGRRSPGPQLAYEGGTPYGARAASPGANIAYGQRAGSPGPGAGGYAPRATSPGPNMAYGGPRATSPGPHMAYGGGYGGRAPSPGPNVALGGRSPSPGPNQALGGRP